MRDASPGYQPSRPGSPGFQLAEDGGFQTQGARVAGDAGVVVGVASTTRAIHGGAHHVAGNVGVVLAVVSATRFVRRAPAPAGGWVAPRRRRRRCQGDVGVVVGVESRTRFVDAIERDEEEVLLLLAALLAVSSSWGPWGRSREEDAALLELVREDDALIARLQRD